MPHVSVKSLNDEQWERWADARRQLYRGVLRNPASSEWEKRVAKEKLKAARPESRYVKQQTFYDTLGVGCRAYGEKDKMAGMCSSIDLQMLPKLEKLSYSS